MKTRVRKTSLPLVFYSSLIPEIAVILATAWLTLRLPWRRSAHQLHQALAALRGDDPQVRLAAVDHLRSG